MANAEIKNFESMSAYQARFGNFFYRFERFSEFDFCGKKAVIKPVFDRKFSIGTFVLTVKAGLVEFKIAFDNDSFLLFHSAIKTGSDYVDVLEQNYAAVFPQELKQALLENLLVECISDFSKKIGEHIEIGDISYDENFSAEKPYLPFLLEMTDQNGEKIYSGLCYLGIPEDMQALTFLEKLEKKFSFSEQSESLSDKALDIPVSFSFVVAETVLNYSDFRELSQGDIILFDEFYGKNSKLRIYPNWRIIGKDKQVSPIDNGYFLANLTENNAEVVEWTAYSGPEAKESSLNEQQNQEDNKMTDSQNEQNKNSEESKPTEENMALSFNIDNFAVNVHFSLGERTLALSELKEIKAGYVFSFEKDFLAPVSLIVQGKTVGKGKIVDINGTVGVQLTEMF